MEISHPPLKKTLPWWTWIAPLLIFQLGTQVALHVRYIQNVSALYLPIPFAIILVNWWGVKRVVPAVYINSFLSTTLWGYADLYQWFIFPIPETLLTFASWFLFTKVRNGKFWLPDARETIRFLWLGLAIPLAVDLLLLQIFLTLIRHHSADRFFENVIRNFFSGLSTSIPVTLGLLYLLTPWLQQKGLLINSPAEKLRLPPKKTPAESALVISIYVALFIFSLAAPFDKFWFGYGIVCLTMALRFGFGEACLCILFVFIITFVLPSFIENKYLNGIFDTGGQLYFVLIGNLLMSLFAALTGRVISDLRMTEEKLNVKNQELQQTNEELDRFVYSVSHDLSAPLKSVQGLVNVSRMDHDPERKEEYLNKISQSVTKLDRFIREVLEYSQNKRLEIKPEKINLSELTNEILLNIEHLENYQAIKIDTSELKDKVSTDRLRLKMILNNIISNAVKFQKSRSGSAPFIKILSYPQNDLIAIEVEDNGEGILPEVQSKIFNMFYRGTLTSRGSGLGLFIAREAAIKLGGDISVRSEYGNGSVFKITIKKELQADN